MKPTFESPRFRAAAGHVLCLHSSGSSGRQWAPLATAWARGLAVAAPDLIGYGDGARWPTGKPASLADEAERLLPLLHAGGSHVVGHSYGAAVALQMALLRPDRVRSLTLYEPVRFALLFGGNDDGRASGEWIVGVGRRIGLDVVSGNLRLAARQFADYWSGDGAWDALDERRRAALAERMPKVQAEFEALFGDRVPAADYRALTMPVHLLGGTRSPLPARLVLDILAACLPRVTRATIEGAGHMGPVTHAAEFAARLPAWLAAEPFGAAA